MRDLLSIGFTMAIYVGYAFILVALLSLANQSAVAPRYGILWGIAGFVTLHLAPAFSLAPEVPGVASADIDARQVWWFSTVIATGIAFWLLAFVPRTWALGAAMALLLTPHLLGAPMPESFYGPVPPELASLFATRALGVGMMAWVLLGVFACYFWETEGQ
jgi:cobalt transporter subunit CbtA